MAKTNFSEKRAYPRFPVDIPLKYFMPERDAFYESHTHDIGARGLCLFSERELPEGASIELHLKMLDDGSKIYRKGKVVWAKPISDSKYRIGIKLEDPAINPIPLVLRTLVAQNHY
ncbi:MAG: PilZ domain-containing protein [Candidatus Omnitrophota bacterium]|nr:PilZ domain-containing protein [Candidatus Omnitrophota bacterium]